MKEKLTAAILELLSKNKIKNQNALVKALKDHGIEADQSTLSRTLNKLGVQKENGFYKIESETKENGLKITVIPPNLVVVKTLPGHAQALGYKIDSQSIAGLVGTLAGDDTVLCMIENPKFLKTVATWLRLI